MGSGSHPTCLLILLMIEWFYKPKVATGNFVDSREMQMDFFPGDQFGPVYDEDEDGDPSHDTSSNNGRDHDTSNPNNDNDNISSIGNISDMDTTQPEESDTEFNTADEGQTTTTGMEYQTADEGQDNSRNDTSGNDLPANDVPSGDTTGNDLPENDVPSGDTSGNDLPANDVPSGDTSGNDLPANDLPRNDTSGNGNSADLGHDSSGLNYEDTLFEDDIAFDNPSDNSDVEDAGGPSGINTNPRAHRSDHISSSEVDSDDDSRARPSLTDLELQIILFLNENAHHCWINSAMNSVKHGLSYRQKQLPEFEMSDPPSFLEQLIHLFRTAMPMQRERPATLVREEAIATI